MRRDSLLRWGLGAGIAAAALAADYFSKRIAEQVLPLGEIRPFLPLLSLQRTANTGVAFGLLRGRVGAVLVATLVAALVVLIFIRMERRPVLGGFAGGLLLAGTMGNALDRLRQGYVTDFLRFPVWPNFNVADICILIGTGLLILGLLLSMVEAQRTEEAQRASVGMPPPTEPAGHEAGRGSSPDGTELSAGGTDAGQEETGKGLPASRDASASPSDDRRA